MARSFRRTPVIGITTAASDKPGKVMANRTLRVAVRKAVSGCNNLEDLVVPELREVSNVWSFPKDGKKRIKRNRKNMAKLLRK